jgi:hypothetical protein
MGQKQSNKDYGASAYHYEKPLGAENSVYKDARGGAQLKVVIIVDNGYGI